PSRREPHFTRILADAAPGLFEIVPEIAARAGDSLWAYGGADTLRAVRARLPEGVTLKAHGPGFGLAVVDAPHATVEAARALVRDIVPFEQRGCLSPRLLLFRGEAAAARGFARRIAAELVRANEQVPAGRLEPDESAEVAKFRDTFAYTGVLEAAASGFVAVTEACLEPAPSGRNLLLFPCAELDASLSSVAPNVTAVGVAGNPELVAALSRALPRARVGPLGRMQRPPIDGPVDRR
ncbi:MAG TPA: acyl-CoA reductase, partial [Polyangiaceae bacterium]